MKCHVCDKDATHASQSIREIESPDRWRRFEAACEPVAWCDDHRFEESITYLTGQTFPAWLVRCNALLGWDMATGHFNADCEPASAHMVRSPS